ncbi:MAG TPA: diguanylate cyclase [Thermoanaerobaculia bacterium]|nr:diguanylate cyclase [Thermoanaerobaculia bacterium]
MPGIVRTPHRAAARPQPLEILNEVARIATLDLELRPMLQRITDALSQKFGWEMVALVSVDHERHVFVCEAVTSIVATSVYPGYSRALSSGVVGEVATTLCPILIDDVRQHSNYVETMAGAMSELCVPVLHKGQLVALLNIESRRVAAFHDQLPLLMTVADQIAGAIASARRYEELKLRARLIEMMSEVSRDALEATDLDGLLQRIVTNIRDRFTLEFAEILMHDHAQGDFIIAALSGELRLNKGMHWPVSQGIIGRCIRTGQTQLVANAATDPEYVSVSDRVMAELVVPIRYRREILGVLNLESYAAESFTPANVVAFEAFADQIAGAIHLASVNARLAETTGQLEQKTRDLEAANQHLSKAIETLHHISTHDGLTGVANRRHFDETLQLEWRRAARTQRPLSLFIADIDHFKALNDEIGHQAGDDCLRRVATTLRDHLHRAADLVARYGGEEFAILLPDTDAASSAALAERMRVAVAATDVTVSIGCATVVPTKEGDAGDLIKRADDALYEAKRAGRNRVVA